MSTERLSLEHECEAGVCRHWSHPGSIDVPCNSDLSKCQLCGALLGTWEWDVDKHNQWHLKVGH